MESMKNPKKYGNNGKPLKYRKTPKKYGKVAKYNKQDRQ